jgi:hypothetical protein
VSTLLVRLSRLLKNPCSDAGVLDSIAYRIDSVEVRTCGRNMRIKKGKKAGTTTQELLLKEPDWAQRMV